MNKSSLMLMLCTALLVPSTAWAKPLKNKAFMQLSEEQQHWWYYGAFLAIGHMVFLHDKEKAQCVWTWFPTEPEKKKALLQKSFKQYPDHTPTGVILALLKRECGSLLPDSP